MANILRKILPTANERTLRRLWPIVEKVNKEFEKLKSLTDDQLRKKTEEFRTRYKEGESLDDLMVEAYAVVKEAARRLVGKKWQVTGQMWEWNMVHYDVQILGAIVLHQGKIAEMATGEGKTLVATMPLYLNALTGRNVHLVTVNDYLARRDAQWMGGLYEFLGVTVGCIQSGMPHDERKKQYECDITYGTNNEFGFDYLRDNMVLRAEDRVQRGHYYAIIDEIDSILIDEARTPLIISGPVERSLNREYARLKPLVERLFRKQTILVNSIIAEAEQLLKEGKYREAGIKLLQAQRGAPKNKRLMKLKQEPGIQRLIDETEAIFLREKKMHELDANLYYYIDERANVVSLTDKGRYELMPQDPDYFTVPDLSEMLYAIQKDQSLSPRERLVKKEAAEREFAEKSARVHALTQLLRAYALFERDVEYVVQDGKVIIVDEFTGRLMPGRRYSDGLHQAIEAKEGVRIQEETQTLATITLQNYFRMYEKLAGMTGTAVDEAAEFWELYKLEVVVIPTHKPVRRVVFPDVVYKTRREKYEAVIREIEEMHRRGRPVLVGTTSVEASEILSRMLKRKGIPHQVLNAKHHEREANIIAQAGQRGKVTIATNMAGRGTDIKLGPGVVKCKECCLLSDNNNCDVDVSQCYRDPPCGLHIIGTERHEARRIDRQLAGRCARQGDPGSVRFYLSLEDDLMRLFGADRIAGLIDRFGPPDGKPIESKLVTKAIESAQKRVERMHFEMRKRLLEYDNVMNKQREVIYGKRNEILDREDVTDMVKESIRNTIAEIVDKHVALGEAFSPQDLRMELQTIVLTDLPIDWDLLKSKKPEEIEAIVFDAVVSEYRKREQIIGSDTMRQLERQIMLWTIDRLWREHLYELDALREGIGLRGYGERDPLVEYKRETFQMFQELLSNIDRTITRNLFGLRIAPQVLRQTRERAPTERPQKKEPTTVKAQKEFATAEAEQPSTQQPLRPVVKKKKKRRKRR